MKKASSGKVDYSPPRTPPVPVSFSTLKRKLHNFRKQPLFVQLWFFPTCILLGITKLLIVLVTFHRLSPLLGKHYGATPLIPILEEESEQRALLISRVVRIAALYTPWDSNCFPQALAARILLGLYGIPYTLHFGLAREKEGSDLEGHAWVVAGRIHVTGGNSFGIYTVVGSFLSPQLNDLIEH